MMTWGGFAAVEPELAESGKALLYQHGVGLGFLATTRLDGGPRVHPMCPLLSSEGAYAFVVPSPKQQDLRRDGRYAIHSFPCPENEDAFYFVGEARLVQDSTVREALARQFVEERSQFPVLPPAAEDALFEFVVASCLLTRTTGHGDPTPLHRVWHSA
jgi:hypothetical protein